MTAILSLFIRGRVSFKRVGKRAVQGMEEGIPPQASLVDVLEQRF